MRKSCRKLATWVSLAIGAAVGCQSSSKTPYADNPLLKSREPVVLSSTGPKPASSLSTGRSPASLPGPIVGANGQMPADAPLPDGPPLQSFNPQPRSMPTPTVVADSKSLELKLPEPKIPEPAAFVPPPLPEPAAPLSAPTIRQTAAPGPTVRFDHAADYSWLQGEVDCHYRGHKELRFCPLSEEDAIGGKVRLADDPRLADFQPGDLIRVEGELVRDSGGPGTFPRFVIRNVRLIERRAK
ncbi:MAG: hypothetical protein ACJ8C4_02250 [Gemmataceae bacterium]